MNLNPTALEYAMLQAECAALRLLYNKMKATNNVLIAALASTPHQRIGDEHLCAREYERVEAQAEDPRESHDEDVNKAESPSCSKVCSQQRS